MAPKLALAMDPRRTRHVFDAQTMDRFMSCCEVLSADPLREFTSTASRAILREVDILVTGWGCPSITPEVLAAAPRLRLIAHAAGTVKTLVDRAAFARGIAVTNAVAANAVPVAEFTFAAIVMAGKRVLHFRDAFRADRTRASSEALMDEPLGNYRRTIGIIGASTIGRRVISLLANLDCRILLHDPFVAAHDPVARSVELVSLDEVMSRSDIVSLHAPLLPSTRGMLGARQFAAMRDGATLINTARGALVDEAALIAELTTGRISAVIDVTDPEIPDAASPLFDLPNVLLTPHIAGAVGTERSRLGRLVADEVERFVAGEPLIHAVDPYLLDRLA